MNADNVRKIHSHAERTGKYVVVPWEGRKLFCDGHLVCVADDLSEKTDCELAPVMVEGAGKVFNKALHENRTQELKEGNLQGSFGVYGYVRDFEGHGFSVYIAEKFRRVFARSAKFFGVAPDKSVAVFELGELVGVVMPVRVLKEDNWPEAPAVVEDDVIYHECPVCSCGSGESW